eukprot:2561492-Pyramimonas_sp.AAC.1
MVRDPGTVPHRSLARLMFLPAGCPIMPWLSRQRWPTWLHGGGWRARTGTSPTSALPPYPRTPPPSPRP